MTSVTYEAATLIDVIKRASAAAPKVSAETERFSGMVLDVKPISGTTTFRTTNENVYYRETIDILSAEGDKVSWRVNANVLSKVIQTFRGRSGDTVFIEQAGGLLEITQLNKKAKLGIIPIDSYPDWYESEIEGADVVKDLGSKIEWVEWATDASNATLGLRVTATALLATDRYCMARAPISIPGLAEPVTLAPKLLKGLIPLMGEIQFKIVGGQLLISANDNSQIRAVTIGEPYQNVEKAMSMTYEHEFRVNKEEILKLINTTLSVQDDKQIILRLFIGDAQLAGISQQDGSETGIRDIIDVVGANHEMCEIWFNPTFLSNAISHCPDEYITFAYLMGKPRPIRVTGESSGYQCWVVPIDPSKIAHGAV